MTIPVATLVACPLCGEPVSLGTPRHVDLDMIMAVVIEGDTFYPHLRDAHPDYWAQACEQQRERNRVLGKMMGAMPRKVNGCFLRTGEDVGDIVSEGSG